MEGEEFIFSTIPVGYNLLKKMEIIIKLILRRFSCQKFKNIGSVINSR